jgi:FPC/CPF motif-containing protein YcgG
MKVVQAVQSNVSISADSNIKFMCKLGKSAVETLQALQTVYGDNVLKRQLCVTGTAASKVGKNH